MAGRTRILLAVGAVVVFLAGGLLGALLLDDDSDDGSEVATDSTTTSSSSTSTTGPGEPAPGSGRTLIVAPEGVLGWWDGTAWVRSNVGVPVPAEGGEEYVLVQLDEAITSATGGPASVTCEMSDAPGIELEPPFAIPEAALTTHPVAIHGVEDPRPRPVTLLDPESAVYREAAREQVATMGIDDDAPRVIEAVRADLLGDGSDEVLLVVERLADTTSLTAGAGDYSMALLRQVVDGSVKTTVVQLSQNDSTPDLPSPYLGVSRVVALADLNGDGRMEIVLMARYYEGSSTVAYEVADDGSVTEALAVGCGA